MQIYSRPVTFKVKQGNKYWHYHSCGWLNVKLISGRFFIDITGNFKGLKCFISLPRGDLTLLLNSLAEIRETRAKFWGKWHIHPDKLKELLKTHKKGVENDSGTE